jgi:phospholipase/carboxylesterase
MSGTEFGEELEKGIAQRMPWLQLHYPNADYRSVTYLGGDKQRAWFDLEDYPVKMNCLHNGSEEATSRVHNLLRQAEENGIPSSRIVLAGFSQGGALALLAGLTYEHAIAGIAAFSSWVPGNLLSVAKHRPTPLFMGHGGEDQAVPYHVGLASCRALQDSGFNVHFSTYRYLSHAFAGDEFDELEGFLMHELPRVSMPSGQPDLAKLGCAGRLRTVSFRSSASTEDESGSDTSPLSTDDERRSSNVPQAALAKQSLMTATCMGRPDLGAPCVAKSSLDTVYHKQGLDKRCDTNVARKIVRSHGLRPDSKSTEVGYPGAMVVPEQDFGHAGQAPSRSLRAAVNKDLCSVSYFPPSLPSSRSFHSQVPSASSGCSNSPCITKTAQCSRSASSSCTLRGSARCPTWSFSPTPVSPPRTLGTAMLKRH